MLPWSIWESVFGQLSMDFSTWIVSGLMIVIGAVWVIVYNADLLLGGAMAVFGRIKALAPVLRMSMAYPLRSRFRTGTTLAMFTLVVFTLVTGSTSTGSFQAALNNVDTFGGGFDIRAGMGARASIPDMRAESRSPRHAGSTIPSSRASPSSPSRRVSSAPAVRSRSTTCAG